MKGIFVTGTDTGIGKTHFTLACIHALQEAGYKVAAMKPVASGAEMVGGKLRNDDALQIQQALNYPVEYELINPYCFEPPVSPHIAAEQAGVEIALDVIKESFDRLSAGKDFVIVEGVGGWLAPLSNDKTVVDLANAIGLPVVMVVGMKLGCLNHASLTLNAIKQSELEFTGWVANSISPDVLELEKQLDYLKSHLGMPALARLDWQSTRPVFLKGLPGLTA